MEKLLKEFAYCTRAERNGFVVLVSLCIIAAIAPYIYPFFLTETRTDFTAFRAAIIEFEQQLAQNKTEKKLAVNKTRAGTKSNFSSFNPNKVSAEALIAMGMKARVARNIEKYRNSGATFKSPDDLKKIYGLNEEVFLELKPFIVLPDPKKKSGTPDKKSFAKTPKSLTPFNFDPNTASAQQLDSLGLSEKIAKTIQNFRAKGGKFRAPADFSKIYGLSPADFNLLKPFIQIEKAETGQKSASEMPFAANEKKAHFKPVKVREDFEEVIIDVNTATIEEWTKLHGIGNWYAKKIVELRDKLGGFSTIGQVAESYSLPDSTFAAIKPFLKHSPVFRKIKLNSATTKELKHPYISWSLAKIIVAYREQHGPFVNIDDLKKIKILKEENFEQMKPYLALE